MIFGRKDYNKRIIDLENLIPEDEPVFFLRGSDILAPELLLKWATNLRLKGGDPATARNAEDHAQRMIEWQKTHDVKIPDMYSDSEDTRLLLERLNKLLDSGNVSSVDEISKLVQEYFNTTSEIVSINLRSDLKIERRGLTLDQIKLDDLDIDPFELRNKKLVLYCTSDGFKVLKRSGF